MFDATGVTGMCGELVKSVLDWSGAVAINAKGRTFFTESAESGCLKIQDLRDPIGTCKCHSYTRTTL